MHGFIAEIAEVGIGNARRQILGHEADYRRVNDNGPVDLIRGSVEIQQKFVAAGGRFSLGAIAVHLEKYPEYETVAWSLTKRETALIERYLDEQRTLDRQLTAQYQSILEKLDQSMSDYLGLLEKAFAPDVRVAFIGSAELAAELGVASEEILDSDEKVDAYFLD